MISLGTALEEFVGHALDAIAMEPKLADAARETFRLLGHLFATNATRTFLRCHLERRTCWWLTGRDRGKKVWDGGKRKSDKGRERGG